VFGVAGGTNTLQISELLLALSLAAMFIASILAIYEENVKRMLAYSSVAQIGYIMFGIGLGNKSGLTGGVVHLFNHAVMKGTLFLALGAVAYRLGTVELADLSGIGRRMPLTCAAFVIGGLGIIGTPGTAGFISKWYLAVGTLDRGWWPLVFLIVASSLISVVYIGRVVEVAYFRTPSGACQNATDPPLNMLLPILLLAAATIYFGIDTELTVNIAGRVAEGLVGGQN
jgi:multicomponent Na+:H+ antiporter subunit D